MSYSHGADSETGRLRTVLAHRPGAELARVTPRTRARLQFPGLPWLSRAQQEHDALTQALRERGVEVLYVTAMLQDALEYPPAREEAISAVLGDPGLGPQLRSDLSGHLASLDPEALTGVLVAGLTAEEFRPGHGLVYGLLGRSDFVIDPLPNLVFTGDYVAWLGPVAVTGLAGRRRRESALVRTLCLHHPRFARTPSVTEPGLADVDGGDVIQLAPGAVALGIGERTTAAGVELLAGQLLSRGLARCVVAAVIPERYAGTPLGALCTMADDSTVIMVPSLAYTLRAHLITAAAASPRDPAVPAGGERPPGAAPAGRAGPVLRVSRQRPFLEAAAEAIGDGPLTLIGTGLDPAAGSREQWDDGGGSLAIASRVMICHERNAATNARLEAAGIEVIRVPGGELAGERGGPRCMACAVSRGPARAAGLAPAGPAAQSTAPTAARLPAQLVTPVPPPGPVAPPATVPTAG